MATVVIPDVDESAFARLQANAHARASTVEADARELLEQKARDLPAVDQEQRDVVLGRLRHLRERIYAEHGPLPDTTELLRTLREEE